MRHPAVARVAAFAVADHRLGEKLCLSVIFHEGADAAPDELLAHLHAAGLSRYDMPEYFHRDDRLSPDRERQDPQARTSSNGQNRDASRHCRCAGPEHKGGTRMFDYRLEHIMSYNAKLGEPEVDRASAGRSAGPVYVTEGAVTGPRGDGKLRPVGGDWLTIRTDGVGSSTYARRSRAMTAL